MMRILLAERVEYVCRKWLDKDAGKWFAKHPEDAQLLAWANKAYTDGKR